MKLYEWLHANNVKQYQLAPRVGCSTSTLNRIVKGSQVPDLKTAWLIECVTDGKVPMQSHLAMCDAASETAKGRGA